MLKVLVIADDLTGANDTGALLRQKGFRTNSSPSAKVWPEVLESCEALCVNCDSRAAVPEEAYMRVFRTAAAYGGSGILVSKRIDSTLRGNVGREIDGVLDALEAGYKAVVVASCPRAGRVCAGGYVLVQGVPLGQSAAASDPRKPVRDSRAASIIRTQTERAVAELPLEVVLRGREAIAKRLKDIREPIVVVDAVSIQDIREISAGCILSGIPAVCIDPGDFTLEMAVAGYGAGCGKDRKNLLAVGSLSKVSRAQVDYLKEWGDTCIYSIDMETLLERPEKEAEHAITLLRSEGQSYKNFCITTVYSKRLEPLEDPADERRRADRIADGVAIAARKVLLEAGCEFGLVYLCGGDIAKAFSIEAGVRGFNIIDELIPLAVYCEIIGGELDGMKVLTKGGMIGDNKSVQEMLSCIASMDRVCACTVRQT